MKDGREVLAGLLAGNRRFAAGRGRFAERCRPERRRELVAGQRPVAAVLGCADSRVPAEMVFDQGLGDLFVVRVAGNVVGPTQLGSLEFAAEVLGVRLVLVLGHQDCGAVRAALKVQAGRPVPDSPHLGEIVSRVLPAAAAAAAVLPAKERLAGAVRANVRLGLRAVLAGSPILRRLHEEEGLVVAGGVYDLATGLVEPVGPGDGP
ncbi:MAG: carbonic anhydrase [Gammaproteobacteria bacterium]|nr:MAG: carbonic anhydrase [Gammaproteobacteria bacterium]